MIFYDSPLSGSIRSHHQKVNYVSNPDSSDGTVRIFEEVKKTSKSTNTSAGSDECSTFLLKNSANDDRPVINSEHRLLPSK